jgi:hypothetical protein
MASSGILRRVDLVSTEDSEERSVSFIRVTRIGEVGTKLAQCFTLVPLNYSMSIVWMKAALHMKSLQN